MDIVPINNKSQDEAFDFYVCGLLEIKKRYSSLLTELNKFINPYTVTLLQKDLREFHEDLWHKLNVLKSEGVLSETLEDVIENIFVFGEDSSIPLLDFKVFFKLKKETELIKPVKEILIDYLNILARYRYPLLALPAEEKTIEEPQTEDIIFTRISELVEQ